ncbi:unnamed protein product [Triticum turgidum subsp. durum]|uniref:GST N-terminal domain-containing protein n=1 Tax=Triticum turgidum subsp. durum TaxID=4567 RepID=A0A9R0VRK9_TRITD|nr:unnamed protein product [Triticum turgidum subsp. durum]
MAEAAASTRKLYGYELSSNSVRIAALLNEKGLDYELVVVDDTKAPEFLAINVLGQVPAFQDGDDILFGTPKKFRPSDSPELIVNILG